MRWLTTLTTGILFSSHHLVHGLHLSPRVCDAELVSPILVAYNSTLVTPFIRVQPD